MQAFKRDTVQFDGVFIGKSSSADVASVEIQNAKITYADQTFATWSGMLNIVKGTLNETWHKERNAFKKITGSMKGIARGGADFSADITTEIVFKNSCSRKYPVSGTIKIVNGGTASTVDYGDGSCDRIYTVDSNGSVTVHTFGQESITSHM